MIIIKYEREYKKNTKNRNSEMLLKLLAVTAVIIFITLLIPILNLADVNCATRDDYGYSIGTRYAWITTHSILQVFKSACDTAYHTWFSWQGTWFDIFVFSLQPELFHKDAYVIVPYMALLLWITSTVWMWKRILVNRLNFNKWYFFIILNCIFNNEYSIYTRDEIFDFLVQWNSSLYVSVCYEPVVSSIFT